MFLQSCKTFKEVGATENNKNSLHIYPKNIRYVDHDYVLDKIMWRYQIQFYRKINIDNKSYYTNE